MSWQSILVKQDVAAQAKPLNFTKKRLPLNIFNILTDNPVNIDGKQINKENVEEYIQGLLDEGKKTGVSRALDRLTPIMEMEEEDFLELHYTDDDKPVPKFKYNKYKKKRPAGLSLFNKLKSMVATGRTTKRDISPVLTEAVNQIRAGNSSNLITYLQDYTQRKKDELVNFENDMKFIKAIRESDDYEQIIALLEKVRPTLAENAKRQKQAKYKAVINEVGEYYSKGQPVLIGTISVEVSELLSKMLKQKGIPHNVLNAKQHKSEAQIVSQAGLKKSITISKDFCSYVIVGLFSINH